MSLIRKAVSVLLTLTIALCVITAVPVHISAAETMRTVMLYCVGSNLESSDKLATQTLIEAMEAEYNDDINFIVMTGGAKRWHTPSEYLSGAESIDPQYNQVWRLEGKRSGESHGKMTLLESTGIAGCGETRMSKPETLTAFLDYSCENYPAGSYDLILWDHGGGPVDGFGYDYRGGSLSLSDLYNAFSESWLIQSGKRLEMIDFDACLMGSTEVVTALGDFADYFICSPEEVPGGGQNHKVWLNAVKQTPAMNGFEIGKLIADDFTETYKNSEKDSECAVMAVVDTKKYKENMLPLLSGLSGTLLNEAAEQKSDGRYSFYDEIYSAGAAYRYGSEQYSLADSVNLVSALSCAQTEAETADDHSNPYTLSATEFLGLTAGSESVYFSSSDDIRVPVTGRNLLGSDGGIPAIRNSTESLVSPVGLSIFIPSKNIETTCSYITAMEKVIEAMPDGKERRFLDQYISSVACYSLIAAFGNTVYSLANSGANEITINVVKEQLGQDISPITDHLSGAVFNGQAETEAYLSRIVAQQMEEALSADKVNIDGNKVTVSSASARTLNSACSGVKIFGNPSDLEFKTLLSLHGYSYSARNRYFPDGFFFTRKNTAYSGSSELALPELPHSFFSIYDEDGNAHIADIHFTNDGKTKGYIPIVVLKGLQKEKNYYLYVSKNDGEWQIDGLAKTVGSSKFISMDSDEFTDKNGEIAFTTVAQMTDAVKHKTTLLPISSFALIDNTKGNWGISVRESNIDTLPELYTCSEQYILTDIYGNEADITAIVNKTPEVILGDTDGNGEVDIHDAALLQMYLAKFSVPESFCLDACDTNSDKHITIGDVTFIQRWIAGLPSNEKIGQPT